MVFLGYRPYVFCCFSALCPHKAFHDVLPLPRSFNFIAYIYILSYHIDAFHSKLNDLTNQMRLKRQTGSKLDGGPAEYLPPRSDPAAPDLYLPLMSFITYVLLVAYFQSTDGKFHPELFGVTTSTCTVLLALEIISILFSMYLFDVANSPPILDLVSYCGYKYVG